MVSDAYADTVVSTMLSWLKGLANWVLRLFNLAGGGSPLAWLSQNWLRLLIILLIVGTVIDFLVWFFRWRPYWVWFRKKRVIINDEDYFATENLGGLNEVDDDELFSANWNKPAQKKKAASSSAKRAAPGKKQDAAKKTRAPAEKKRPSTKVPKREAARPSPKKSGGEDELDKLFDLSDGDKNP